MDVPRFFFVVDTAYTYRWVSVWSEKMSRIENKYAEEKLEPQIYITFIVVSFLPRHLRNINFQFFFIFPPYPLVVILMTPFILRRVDETSWFIDYVSRYLVDRCYSAVIIGK